MMTPKKFDIPASFWLHGQQFHVSMVPDLIETKDCVGEALYRCNAIRLQSHTVSVNRPVSHIEVTFLHELMHCIFEALGEDELRQNALLVNGIALLLHQALVTADGSA